MTRMIGSKVIGMKPAVAQVSRRKFWGVRAMPKPMAEQVKPIIYDTLIEVYKPLLDKLTSIDEKLGKIEMYVDKYAPKYVSSSGNEDVQMVDTKDMKND